MDSVSTQGDPKKHKNCSRCKESQGLDQFAVKKSGHLDPWCRLCRNAYYRDRYKENPEIKRLNTEKHREWARKNAEHVRAYQKRERIDKPDMVKNRRLRKDFGITLVEYREIEQSQLGGCAICGKPCGTGRQLAVDHDHSCCPGKTSCGKCVRGLLCGHCNQGLGRFNDNPELLRAAAEYLLKFRNAG